uniref:Uncharacterized protein n=1 Tax=Ananas comosus var. bracteatus TaxID=296719 RepID=A0A6V7PUP2_ANACO|nr:unnamed protein product [Ananas comosus var. bracteatus]
MFSSEAVVVDVVPKPRATKRGKIKEPRTLARESVSLDDRVGVLEDSAVRAEERYSDLSQHVGMLEEGFHLMEKDIVAAMATFRHRLEQFKVNLVRRNDERDVRDMLFQDIGAQVKEVEDLKTREALPERTEGDREAAEKGGSENGPPRLSPSCSRPRPCPRTPHLPRLRPHRSRAATLFFFLSNSHPPSPTTTPLSPFPAFLVLSLSLVLVLYRLRRRRIFADADTVEVVAALQPRSGGFLAASKPASYPLAEG